MKNNSRGNIRVARYDFKNKSCPKTPGYTNILIHVKDKLSPYILVDEHGRIMENIWQFRKIYPMVRPQRQTVHKYTSELGWCWKSEKHIDKKTDKPTDKYWHWRQSGQSFKHPVRYPNGYDGRGDCKSVLLVDDGSNIESGINIEDILPPKIFKLVREYCNNDLPVKHLDRTHGRALVYFKTYARLARKDSYYSVLKRRLLAGENIQIVEVDGPPIDDKVTRPFELVKNGSIEVNKYVIQEWLKSRYSFGHGICLAVCLLDADEHVYKNINLL